MTLPLSDLRALREAVAKMLGGDWIALTWNGHGWISVSLWDASFRMSDDDADTIVALRNAAPALLDELIARREADERRGAGDSDADS